MSTLKNPAKDDRSLIWLLLVYSSSKFFNQTNGCAICIAVCPWSRPGVGMNLAAKLARRADRLEAE